MAAIERRGLFSVKATRWAFPPHPTPSHEKSPTPLRSKPGTTRRLILICTWLLSWYNMIAALHAADYFSAMRDFVSTARQDHFRDTVGRAGGRHKVLGFCLSFTSDVAQLGFRVGWTPVA